MRALDIIIRKRDGAELGPEEIDLPSREFRSVAFVDDDVDGAHGLLPPPPLSSPVYRSSINGGG